MANGSAFTVTFDRITAADHGRVGGKCASLGDMTRAGVAVPPGFAVTTDAFAAMMQHHGLAGEIQRALAGIDHDDIDSVDRAAQGIRIRIRSHHLPAEVETAIRAAYLAMGDSVPVAVRSSATAEDLPDASFAGQQDTYLWVVGVDEVIAKVRDCWASLYSTRAVAYRARNRIPGEGLAMSVGVQRMVNARTAGVAMTLDPNTGDRTRVVVDASWGLGELVVSGVVTPDHFSVDKVLNQIVVRTISHKHVELVADPAAGEAVEREITGPRAHAPSLSDDEVMAVVALARSLEKQKGCPQDVEWAIDADLPAGRNLVALQSRPETVWSQKNAAAKKTYSTGMMGIVGALTGKAPV